MNPPSVYTFGLPPPNEHVECCYELEDADVIYEELVRYEHEHNIDPFDVQISLDQLEWGHAHQPRKTLFVLTAGKLG